MKFITTQEDLKSAVSLASRFTSPKAQLPILGNILLRASKSQLTIAATNLETSVSTNIGVKTEKEGEVTVPGRVLLDTISNLSSGQVNIESEKEKVKITSGGFKSSLLGMDSTDFPKIPEKAVKTDAISLNKADLVAGLNKVSFAVSNDDTRPVLTGVLFVFKGKNIYLVSTDGFRLSQKVLFVDQGVGKDLSNLIIPKSILSEISRYGDGEDFLMSFRKSDNLVVFSDGETTFSSRVIEGEYPDFEKIIPKKSTWEIEVDREEMIQSIRLASVFARDSSNIVKIVIDRTSLSVSSESASSGSQETKIDARVETEEKEKNIEISYNFRFIEELLHVIDGDSLQIKLSGPNSPCKFMDPKDPNFLHLVMPIRVEG